MAFTEFYVQTTGSNLNAGSTADNAAAFTYAGGTFVRSSGVFTVASGNPQTDGVTAGMFASIYTTSGATVATCVGRITARDATTITISLEALAGATSAVSEGAGEATCKVGGAWAGPNGAVGFPFAFSTAALNDGTNTVPRVNFKGGTNYAVTAAIVNSSVSDGIVWQGYTTTVGDGGKATIDGGESGAAYALFTSSASQSTYIDLVWAHNGETGGSTGTPGVYTLNGSRNIYIRCVVHGMRASGFTSNGPVQYVECETYDCNRANQVGYGGFALAVTGSQALRCYAHHHAGSNANGFTLDQTVVVSHCISHSNGAAGFYSAQDQNCTVLHCDAYNNGGAGLNLVSASATLVVNIQNCNFVKNGDYGIKSTSTGRYGIVANCGFGAGTQANTNGQMTSGLVPVLITGAVTYADDVTPWTDPANGDFRVSLAAAKNAGRGAFTQTYTSESARNTTGYPDIGAAFANLLVVLGFRFWTYSS